METAKTWVGAVLLTAVLAFGSACDSEGDGECSRDDCGVTQRPRLPEPTAPADPSVPPCEQVCAVLDECEVLDEDGCMLACTHQGFTDDERRCFARANCGDSMARCFDTER